MMSRMKREPKRGSDTTHAVPKSIETNATHSLGQWLIMRGTTKRKSTHGDSASATLSSAVTLATAPTKPPVDFDRMSNRRRLMQRVALLLGPYPIPDTGPAWSETPNDHGFARWAIGWVVLPARRTRGRKARRVAKHFVAMCGASNRPIFLMLDAIVVASKSTRVYRDVGLQLYTMCTSGKFDVANDS
eukprot:6117685-Pyramimonas_sp.AAC.2